MTALSIYFHARRLGPGKTRLALPIWPVVFLGIALWMATCCSGASASASTPATNATTDADWLGRSRDEVVDTLGRPLSALQRGDTEVLMYAQDVRVEIRGGEVVAYRSGRGPAIVASDGTQYAATDRGKVQRVARAPSEDAAAEAEKEIVVVATPPRAAPAAPAPAAENEPEPLAEEDVELPLPDELEEMPSDGEVSEVAGDQDFMHPISEAIEDLSNRGMSIVPEVGDEEEKEPLTTRIATGLLFAALRFGFAVLMLRIAISWVELPCYMPDVCKVAFLYVVVREGMHGLADFGGHWEWIRLFKIDDGVSYLAMMYLLWKFKIALSGLTALKIATATVAVTYFLMLIMGVALSFMMG